MIGGDADYADYLIAEARSGNSAFHEFRLLYSVGSEEVHAFFEGEDDPIYYAPHIRARLNGRALHSYVCEGKWKVRDVRDFIYEDGYSRDNCLFFVDRDYDDLFSEQIVICNRTFITVPYSVEHYVAVRSAAEIIVDDFAGFSAADPERAVIFTRLEMGRESFGRHMRLLTAWALAQREEGRRPNFQNVLLKNVMALGDGYAFKRKRRGYDAFKRACCGNAGEWKTGSVRKWLAEIDDMDRRIWMRGKFELWAFNAILVSALDEAVRAAKARGKKGIRVPASLRQQRPFDMLGGRLAPPPELDAFLTATFVAV